MYYNEMNSGFIGSSDDINIAYKWSDISLLHQTTNGYSSVYKAKRYGQWYTLKCLTPEVASNPQYQNLLEKEFAISIDLHHPNIVRTVGYEVVEGLGPCIIQEYIDGLTWSQFFDGEGSDTSRHDIEQLIAQLCEAIDYIHSHQVLHRDLKPDNIMITHQPMQVKLIDFGLADKQSFDILKSPAGTYSYLSPEVRTGGCATFQSDLYSLGVILQDLPRQWHSLRRQQKRCLRQDPNQRPSSAEDVASGASRRIISRRSVLILLLCAAIPAAWYLARTYYAQRHQEPTPATTQHVDMAAFKLAGDENSSQEPTPATPQRVDTIYIQLPGDTIRTTIFVDSSAEANNRRIKKIVKELLDTLQCSIERAYAVIDTTTIIFPPKNQRTRKDQKEFQRYKDDYSITVLDAYNRVYTYTENYFNTRVSEDDSLFMQIREEYVFYAKRLLKKNRDKYDAWINKQK